MKTLLLTFVAAFLTFSAVSQADDAKPYPLGTCIISGEKLGEMGEPYVMVKDGQEVKFCCKMCRPDFEKDPSKYLKKIEEATSPKN